MHQRRQEPGYEPLATGQRTAMINALARQVLTLVPAHAHQQADIAEYRALVAPSQRKMIEA